ncbi:MAG: sulfatase [Alphaproteobacteria bacterium]|nr:sulfatase [Alphaproteobacteria bacterium]
MLLALLLLGCTCTPRTWTPPPPAPPTAVHTAVSLGRTTPARITLAPTTRAEGAPTTFTPLETFRRAQSPDGVAVWATPLPVDFHVFLERGVGARTFGNWAPSGLQVRVGERVLSFQRGASRAWSFGFDEDVLYVGLPLDTPRPEPADVVLSWPRATSREEALHYVSSGQTPEDFLRRTVILGTSSHTGLLLPAPSRADWILTVPERGLLAARARILPPAIVSDRPSDGAVLEVGVSRGESREVVDRIRVGSGWADVRVDLSRWAGQEIGLSLASTSPDTRLDLVFVEEPAVYTPREDPRVVVLAFVDTVRPDHLGMYGYARPTTPRLDRWAATAVRFDAARSVAPWTLPSTLSALTGEVPEQAPTVPSLADRLAAEGFATTGIVANAYLSQVFGPHRGFGRYHYRILQPAAATVDQALDVLATWPGRDQLLLVQFMEAHLPYREPRGYRNLFAGEAPDGHATPLRARLVRVQPDDGDFPAVKQWVVDRYDQNLRVLDDEVGRLFESLPDDAVTVLFADHGEEFWDHGGFEHGHTFHDELLRIPFVVRAPGLAPGAVSTPVSLLDLTPTVLDLLGLEVPDVRGRSLAPLARGDGADDTVPPQGFGHPLYGEEGWGVLSGDRKWVRRGSTQELYLLDEDPAERVDRANTLPLERYPADLETALGRKVPAVWRVSLHAVSASEPVTLTLTHPDGLLDAWPAYDPRARWGGTTFAVEDGQVVVTQPPQGRMAEVFFVRPAGDPEHPEGLTLSLTHGGSTITETAGPLPPAAGGARRRALEAAGRWSLAVDLVHTPEPGGHAVDASAPGMEGELRELGYLDDDE